MFPALAKAISASTACSSRISSWKNNRNKHRTGSIGCSQRSRNARPIFQTYTRLVLHVQRDLYVRRVLSRKAFNAKPSNRGSVNYAPGEIGNLAARREGSERRSDEYAGKCDIIGVCKMPCFCTFCRFLIRSVDSSRCLSKDEACSKSAYGSFQSAGRRASRAPKLRTRGRSVLVL